MEFDEIGRQIENSYLTDSLQHFAWQIEQCVEICNSNGQQVIEPLSIFKNDCKYLKQNKNNLIMCTREVQDLIGVKEELKLQENIFIKRLDSNKLLWPFSMGLFKNSQETLGAKIRVMLPELLFKEMYEITFKKAGIDYVDFRNQVYLKIAQQLIANRYVFTYFFGATPFNWLNGQKENSSSPQRSVANYLNPVQLKEVKALMYTNLDAYLDSQSPNSTLDNIVIKTQNFSGKERKRAIECLEIRGCDFNPNSELRMDNVMLTFINVVVGYFLMTPGIQNVDLQNVLNERRELNQKIATENPFAKTEQYTNLRKFLEEINNFAKKYSYPNWQEVYNTLNKRLNSPEETPAAKVLRNQGNAATLTDAMLQKKNFNLIKLGHLDYNSQSILEAAILRGIDFQVIIEEKGIVKIGDVLLAHGLQTTHNSALMQEIWSDKQSAKQLIASIGYRTAKGWCVRSLQELDGLYSQLEKRAVVVKSATATYSTQTQVFRLPPTESELKRAVANVLKDTKRVLIEQVVSGAVYRALIVKGKVISLIERIPVNIVGDGRNSVQKLIENYNNRVSLTRKIRLQKTEINLLKKRGIGLERIIPRGTQVLLRYDATEKTGCQTVESINEVDESYLEELAKMAVGLKMAEGAIDIIIPNLYQPYTAEHSDRLVFLNAHSNVDFELHENVLMQPKQDVGSMVLQTLIE